jgi:YhcN/YlaJ family sporulation lipoprotein
MIMRYWTILIIILSVIAAGCNNNGNEAAPSPNQDQNIRTKQTAPNERPDIQDPENVAERLENIAERIPQVKSANCVVFGDTAIIGINVDGKLDRSRVGTIKYSVAEALRKDPYGAHAIVTADMDLNQRLREIRRDIQNGRPAAGFAEELADIVGRIVPQLPKDTRPQNVDPTRNEDRAKLGRENL